MPENVYFIPARCDEGDEVVSGKLAGLLSASGLLSCFAEKDFTAVKIHVGETGNRTYARAAWLAGAVAQLKAAGARPFLTDTATLYSGRRSNAVVHAELAAEHGFCVAGAGAPFLPPDGLYGDRETPVAIDGEIYDEVSVAAGIRRAQSMLVVSHLTGHIGTGMGAAIKNLGMGCTGRTGKRRQHSAMAPRIKAKKCTACGECVACCPVGAIRMDDAAAVIDADTCIGCGQCLAICRFGAVSFDWGIEGPELQRRMAEYALGAVDGKAGRLACVTFLLQITDGCDCMGRSMDPAVDDIGIIAAVDPVAVDAAAMHLVAERSGTTMAAISGKPAIDAAVQLAHGEKVGLGTRDFQLVALDEE